MADAPASIADLTFEPAGPVHPSPADWRDEVLYELMVDRFDDGRDRPRYDPATAPGRPDPKGGEGFQGGTLRGIARRLDYLAGLGVTALWVTPALKGRPGDAGSYHGYATQDFLDIDPRFGTAGDFRDLVRRCHDRGIRVVMDIVIEHAGDVWAYPDDRDQQWDGGNQFPFGHWRRGGDGGPLQGPPTRDDAVWPVEFQRPGAFRRQGRMRDPGAAVDAEATEADFVSLKKLDLEQPAVLAAVISVYKYWIATADVDGFRIDAFRHVAAPIARRFCNAIREFAASIGKLNFLMVGEIAGDGLALPAYVASNCPLPGDGPTPSHPLLEAVLDFELYEALPKLLLGTIGPKKLLDRFAFLNRHYRDPGLAGRHYVTFTENHDGAGDGQHHRLLHGNNDGRLAVLAAGFLLTSVGIPCLYYGQEQAFDGGGDSDKFHRENLFGGDWGAFGTTGVHFFDRGHPVYRAIANLAAVRRRHPALRYGRQLVRDVSDDGVRFAPPEGLRPTLAYSRVLSGTEIVVVMNLSTDDRADGVRVDAARTPAGTELVDLTGTVAPLRAEATPAGGAFVRVPLGGRAMAVLARRT